MTTTNYELQALNDTRKSFYDKAIVEIDTTKNTHTLYSYGRKVAKFNTGSEKMEVYETYSVTTLRHIKEFIYQMLFIEGLTKTDIENLYMEGVA